MREIKFRVFDGTDCMSSPFTLQDIQDGKVQFASDCPIMQYTGLKDRNGVEIYEGDIVRLDDIETTITWADGSFQMITNENQGKSQAIQDRVKRFEVIGNIYEKGETK